MAEIRYRGPEESQTAPSKDKPGVKEHKDDTLGTDPNAAASLPQAKDDTAKVIDDALKDLTPRWRNWIIRGLFTWVMIFFFALIIYIGPLALVLLIFAIQIKCFHEIILIGYVVYKSYDLPWFRTLSWYFLFASNYFFFGESMIQYFGVLLSKPEFMKPFVTYHRFISFSLYVMGFVGFVFSLVKTHYLKQFTLFGWTHVTLLIVVTQSHLIIQNIFEGLVWILVPVSMIICNDIMAYMFGFFFGKTPLIKLSPKKTWEGFIGGAFSTVVFGIVLSYVLVQYDYFVCPIEYDEVKETLHLECERSPVFKLTEYALPKFIQSIFAIWLHKKGTEMPAVYNNCLKSLRIDKTSVQLYPFILHSIAMATFASIIGPFGGFFASGFKRAFKIKDFGDTIPGHGGIMDRFDCQFLMATFVHVYYSSFIRAANPQKIVQLVLAMKPEEQLQVYNMLKDSLVKRGMLALQGQ